MGTLPAEAAEASRDPDNRLGRYVLVSRIGRGGMGQVHRAWDTELDRWVAIKIVRTGLLSQGNVDRFRREVHLAARVQHPHIAHVYDAGEERDVLYLVMELIEGRTLDALIRDVGERSDERRMARIIRDASRAVGAAHALGILHRDLKPSNIMVDASDCVHVLDFGLALALGDLDAALTTTGVPVGTPQFMAPEQARCPSRELDARTDVYQLGTTLWTLLAARPPFPNKELVALLISVLNDPVPSVRSVRPDVSEALDAILVVATSKPREERYASATQLADALDAYLEGRRPPPTPPAPAVPAPVARPSMRAMLVEDDENLAPLLKYLLATLGFHVSHHTTGEAAVRDGNERGFDLVVLDGRLPSMSGFDVLRQLRSLAGFVRTPIVMLTSMDREEDVVRGLDLGADDYVKKPFAPGEFLARIRRLIRRA